MSKNKLVPFIFYGALVGAAVSMFDKTTRKQVTEKSKNLTADVRFYAKNPDIFTFKVREKKEKFQTVFEQLSGDVSYIKEQVEELKTLTPQVKELVVNTKDAFVESKDEYKALASDNIEQSNKEK
ncbi:YtxH domain-containing protein [Sporosarcina sp. FSL K6-1522]|uniref:YtxH domain-containing protein n=1 Tax=Sporosarcina sp. FSL K6-1522 TaxID=2921554 RepID=UPI00315A1B9C